MPSCTVLCKRWLFTVIWQLRSLAALCLCVARYSPGHRLLCAIHLYEFHRQSPGCCCIGAALERHHGCYVRLCYSCGYVMVVATAAVSTRREVVLWLRASQERINCLQFLWVFDPSFSLLACPSSTLGSTSSVNSETIGGMRRISNTDIVLHSWQICIVMLHHNKKEKQGANFFHWNADRYCRLNNTRCRHFCVK